MKSRLSLYAQKLFTTITLFLFFNYCANVFSDISRSLENYIKDREINYCSELKESILLIQPVPVTSVCNMNLLATYEAKLNQIDEAISNYKPGIIVFSSEILLSQTKENLKQLVSACFKAGADIAIEGKINTNITNTITKNNYIFYTGLSNHELSFYQPLSIPTANKHGHQIRVDLPIQTFAELAAIPGAKSLDIGGGYGVASIRALKAGAKNIHAWEKSSIMASSLENAVMKTQYKDSLTSKNINFIDYHVTTEDKDSFDVILMSRVLHLFTPEEINESAKKLYDLLKPGGKLIISGETPFIKSIEEYIPIYLEKISNDTPWPGHINKEDFIRYFNPERAKQLSTGLTLFDLKTPANLFSSTGFIILKNEYINRQGRHDKNVLLDEDSRYAQHRGKESIWLLLQKP
jgi:SAM-dependent methyltransferase